MANSGAELTLDVLTLVVAAVGPVIAYHYARRLALSGNRQKWLDSLRSDIAELIALSDHTTAMRRLREKDGPKAASAEVLLENMTGLQSLRFRIRLLLTRGKASHDRLTKAVEAYAAWPKKDDTPWSSADRKAKRDALLAAAEAVLQETTSKLDRGG